MTKKELIDAYMRGFRMAIRIDHQRPIPLLGSVYAAGYNAGVWALENATRRADTHADGVIKGSTDAAY